MNGNNDLKILITGSLNVGKSIGEINTQIKAIEKKINKLKLNVQIDDKITKTLKDFSKAMEKMKEHQQDLQRSYKEEETVVKKLDGSIEKTTKQYLKNGEIIEKTRKTIDERTKSIEKETKALGKQADELDDVSGKIQKLKTIQDGKGNVTGTTQRYRDDNNFVDTTVKFNQDGRETSRTIVENYDQEAKAAQKSADEQRKANQQLVQEKRKLRQELSLLEKQGKITTEQFKQLRTEARQKENIVQVKSLRDELAKLKISNDLIRQKEKLHQKLKEIKREGRLTEQQFNQLSASINSVGNVRGLDKVKADLREVQGVLKNVGMMEQLKVAMSRIPIWMVGMTAFYAPLHGMQDLINQVIELDTQMTSLMRVSNGEIDREHILSQSVEMAERLGNQIHQINAGLENFARQGFRGEGLIAMTESATMFSNISDMSVDEAASGITSIVNGFQMLPSEAQKAVDAINEVDNNYAISSQNIVQSMSKSVGSAQTFGVEMEKLIGYTTAIKFVALYSNV